METGRGKESFSTLQQASSMKKVISFSIWGQDPKYLQGALRNADLAREIYPGWVCRFYCGQSVPLYYIAELSSKDNCELVMMNQWGDWKGLYWRFVAASDPQVDIMISRDTDSRLNEREKSAVQEWIESDKLMHIMRDHPFHGYPVLGGMWGAKRGAFKDMQNLIDNFSTSDAYGTDYEFFRQVGLPHLGIDKILVHDEFFEKKKFPTSRNGYEFVGEVYDQNDNHVKEHRQALIDYLQSGEKK